MKKVSRLSKALREIKPEPPRSTEVGCALSLDGGAVRCVSTLYLLHDLMERFNSLRNDQPPLKPCDVFDLIGGINTGGLIAIMLGCLEMGCLEMITEESIKALFAVSRRIAPGGHTTLPSEPFFIGETRG